MCRVTLSVPSVPTTVVMPAVVKSLSITSGVRVAKPPSPPPPIRWTCWSMNPGTTKQPVTSTTSVAP